MVAGGAGPCGARRARRVEGPCHTICARRGCVVVRRAGYAAYSCRAHTRAAASAHAACQPGRRGRSEISARCEWHMMVAAHVVRTNAAAGQARVARGAGTDSGAGTTWYDLVRPGARARSINTRRRLLIIASYRARAVSRKARAGRGGGGGGAALAGDGTYRYAQAGGAPAARDRAPVTDGSASPAMPLARAAGASVAASVSPVTAARGGGVQAGTCRARDQ